MNGVHDETHEEFLQSLLFDAAAADSAEGRRRLESCPACRAEWVACVELERDLEDAGRVRAEELAAVDSAEGAPGEARVATILRALARAGRPAAPRRRRTALWLVTAAAAAGLVLAVFLGRRDEPAARPGIRLGAALECVAPKGTVARYQPFHWRGDLPPGGWFEVTVLDEEGGSLLRSGRIRTNVWDPGTEARAALPPRIAWEVAAHDAASVTEIAGTQAALERP